MLKESPSKPSKIYPAKQVARGAMSCPSCRAILDRAVSACLKCGFSAEVAVKKFPFPAPDLVSVIDPSSALTESETASLQAQVAKLEKRFPQIHFFNCIVPLGSGIDLREFGFWLLNGGKFSGGADGKAFAVLFLVDPKGQALSVTVGYGLEPMIMDTEWEGVCNRCKDLFYRGKYLEGIESFLRYSGELLAQEAVKIRKELGKK